MNFFGLVRSFKSTGNKKRKTRGDFYQDSISRIGAEQLKRLIKKGINLPVALL